MSEQATAEQKRVVVFEGRNVEVRIPSVEQLALSQRLVKSVQRLAEKGNLNGKQVIAYYDQSQGLIKSLIVKTEDREWLDDLFMYEGLTLEKAFDIVAFATDQFRDANEPSNGPAPKKAAARRTGKK